MVKLVDRVRAIALDWDQVKAFIKANFTDLKKTTIPDQLRQRALDHYEDRDVIKKAAGPMGGAIENRGEKKNGEDASVKDIKKSDKNYNEKQTKRDEDLPDQPMKKVTEPGKDPDSKNKNIEKTSKVKAPKHKNEKGLKVPDKKTPKFTLKQVKP
jgi:Ni,Fe-hydrogenase I large subunit